MPRQTFGDTFWINHSSGAAVASTAAETILFPNINLLPSDMRDGKLYLLKANGQHSTLGSGTVTLTFFIRLGGVAGTLICKTGAITQLISLTAAFWELEALLHIRSNGSSGTIMGNGIVRVFGATAPTIGSATGAPAIAPMTNGGQITPATATVDFTSAQDLALTVQHGASSASNTVTGLQELLMTLN